MVLLTLLLMMMMMMLLLLLAGFECGERDEVAVFSLFLSSFSLTNEAAGRCAHRRLFRR